MYSTGRVGDRWQRIARTIPESQEPCEQSRNTLDRSIAPSQRQTKQSSRSRNQKDRSGVPRTGAARQITGHAVADHLCLLPIFYRTTHKQAISGVTRRHAANPTEGHDLEVEPPAVWGCPRLTDPQRDQGRDCALVGSDAHAHLSTHVGGPGSARSPIVKSIMSSTECLANPLGEFKNRMHCEDTAGVFTNAGVIREMQPAVVRDCHRAPH